MSGAFGEFAFGVGGFGNPGPVAPPPQPSAPISTQRGMRVRQMTASGDMTFGQGSGNFLVNTPAAVAQACMTRLKLWTNEWFLDLTAGTPYSNQVLGEHTQSLYDAVIQQRILETPGMVGLASYQSNLDGTTRVLTIQVVAVTQFGATDAFSIPLTIGN